MTSSGRQWALEQYQLGISRPQLLHDFDPPLSFEQRSARRVLSMVRRKLAATPVPADALPYWLEARTEAVELLAYADIRRALRQGDSPEKLLVALIPLWHLGLPQHVRGELGRFLHTYYTDILEVLRAHLWGRAPDPGPGFHSVAGWLELYARAPSDALVEALADRYGIIDTAPKNDVLDLRDAKHRATGNWPDRLTSALYRRVEDFPPSPPGAQVVRWVERRYYRALAYPQALYYQDGSTDLRADSLPYRAAEHVTQLVVTEQHRWSPVEYQRAHQRAVQLVGEAKLAEAKEAARDRAAARAARHVAPARAA